MRYHVIYFTYLAVINAVGKGKKAKPDERLAQNFDCDVSKPRRSVYVNFSRIILIMT